MYKHVYTLYFNKKRKDKPQEIRPFFAKYSNFAKKKKNSIEKPLPKVI